FEYTSRGTFGALHWQDQPTSDLPVYRALLDGLAGTMFIPEVQVQAATPVADEHGPVPGVFRLTRTSNPAVALAVNYQVSGTATTRPYAALGPTIVFPAGQSTVDVVITPTTEKRIEGDRQLTITLVAGAGYTVDSAAGSATMTIKDDDALSSYALPIQNPSF